VDHKPPSTDRKFDSAPSAPDSQGGDELEERGTFDPRSVFCACLVQHLEHLLGLFRGLARPRRSSLGLSCAKNNRISARLKDAMDHFRT